MTAYFIPPRGIVPPEMEVDAAPAQDSPNLVTSGGVYVALEAKQDRATVVTDTNTTSVTLAPQGNHLYKYGTLYYLNVTDLGDFDDEYTIIFTAGAGFDFDNTVFDGNWVGAEQSPSFEAGKRYVISVCNGIAVMGGVNVP